MLTAEFLSTPHTYGDLLAQLEPSPIRSREQYVEYLDIVDVLIMFVHRHPDDEPIQKLLDLYVQLVEHYEEGLVEEPDNALEPAALIRHLMENRGMSQAELARRLSVDRSAANHVLTGGRKVPSAWAAVLAREFELPAGWFLER